MFRFIPITGQLMMAYGSFPKLSSHSAIFVLFFKTQSPRNTIQTPVIAGHGLPPKKTAERKRLLNYGVSFWHCGSEYHRDRENTAMMKKKCPRFSEKEGAGEGEQRLKDMA